MLKLICLALVLFATSGLAPSQERISRFAGTWEAKWNGAVFCVLTLVEDAKVTGTILSPGSIRVNHDGDLIAAEPNRTGETLPLLNAVINGRALSFEFKPDDETERLVFTLTDDGKADLQWVGLPMKPIHLERK
jgi:hypothetical protein